MKSLMWRIYRLMTRTVFCVRKYPVSGDINPAYTGTYVFQNDFSALRPQPCTQPENTSPLFQTQAVSGLSRVLCFSPDHSKTLPELPVAQIRAVIDTWQAQAQELGEKYLWVQLFENKGELMGCSQPHPHGQIWAGDFLPDALSRKDGLLRDYSWQHGSNLLLDYAQAEPERRQPYCDGNGALAGSGAVLGGVAV